MILHLIVVLPSCMHLLSLHKLCLLKVKDKLLALILLLLFKSVHLNPDLLFGLLAQAINLLRKVF